MPFAAIEKKQYGSLRKTCLYEMLFHKSPECNSFLSSMYTHSYFEWGG